MKKLICIIVITLQFIAYPTLAEPDFQCLAAYAGIFSSQTQSISSTIHVGLIPIDVAVNSSTNTVYISNFGSDSVSIINGSNNTIISTVSVGGSPYGISVNKETNKIYVANQLDNSVSVIDGSTNTVSATIPVDLKPIQLAINPKTNKIYVVNQNSNKVFVIDGSSNTVTGSISVGELPFGIEVNTKTNKIYVANSTSNTVSVIDGATNSVIKTIENLGESTYNLTIDEENNKIYAFSLKGEELLDRGLLFEINGSTDTVTETQIVGSNGTDIAIHPKTKRIYVTHTFNGTIDGYDLKKKQLLCIITTVDSPTGIAINSQTNSIYVCNNDLSTVTILEDSDAKISENSNPENPIEPNNPEETTELQAQISEAIGSLRKIQVDLKAASKFTRSTASRLLFFINKLDLALNKPASKCDPQSKSAIDGLNSIIDNLESKKCTESRTRRCISEEEIDNFTSDLEEQIDIINLIIETDDDENDISDVCE